MASERPLPKKRPPRRRLRAALAAVFMAACAAGAVGWLATGCEGSGWDPLDPFKRNAPEVNEAIGLLDAGQHESAEKVLTEYLGTGPCSEDGLSLPDRVRQRPNGSFDLGLTLFNLAEEYGRRFGEEEEEEDDEEPVDEEEAAQRNLEIDCALAVVGAIAGDQKVDVGLRARAHYLAGNLEFMRKNYPQAVRHYDQALRLIPGMVEEAGGDGIGRDAAHNRAIALRRIEEQQEDAGADAEPDAEPDGGEGEDGGDPNSEGDAGPDGGGGQDAGQDGGGEDDEQGEQGEDEEEDPGDQGGEPPPPEQGPPQDPEQGETPQGGAESGADQDDRLLDEFEEAPTYQEQEARRRNRARLRSMEDK